MAPWVGEGLPAASCIPTGSRLSVGAVAGAAWLEEPGAQGLGWPGTAGAFRVALRSPLLTADHPRKQPGNLGSMAVGGQTLGGQALSRSQRPGGPRGKGRRTHLPVLRPPASSLCLAGLLGVAPSDSSTKDQPAPAPLCGCGDTEGHGQRRPQGEEAPGEEAMGRGGHGQRRPLAGCETGSVLESKDTDVLSSTITAWSRDFCTCHACSGTHFVPDV